MEIFLAIALSLIAGCVGYLGVLLTMYPAKTEREKRRYKRAFIVLPLLATGLIVWQAILTRNAQNALQAQLFGISSSIVDIGSEIKNPKTSKEPTQVASNLKPYRSHIHVTAVDLIAANPGGAIQSRVHMENDGNAPITHLRNYIAMAVQPFSSDMKTQTEIEESIFEKIKQETKDFPIVPFQIPAHSIVLNSENHGTNVLTPHILGEVKTGQYAIYLVGRILYEDSDIVRRSDYCLWTKGDVNGMKFCFMHNEEE